MSQLSKLDSEVTNFFKSIEVTPGKFFQDFDMDTDDQVEAGPSISFSPYSTVPLPDIYDNNEPHAIQEPTNTLPVMPTKSISSSVQNKRVTREFAPQIRNLEKRKTKFKAVITRKSRHRQTMYEKYCAEKKRWNQAKTYYAREIAHLDKEIRTEKNKYDAEKFEEDITKLEEAAYLQYVPRYCLSRCRNYEKCMFAHPPWKICRHYRDGTCRNGTNCTYDHVEPRACKYVLNCPNRSTCRDAHPIINTFV